MTKRMGPRRRRVDRACNSVCAYPIHKLDFSEWWMDGGNNCLYLHVKGPEETYHRVYCRGYDSPRLMVKDGILYWLIDKKKPEEKTPAQINTEIALENIKTHVELNKALREIK